MDVVARKDAKRSQAWSTQLPRTTKGHSYHL